jgi:hypothetical protein
MAGDVLGWNVMAARWLDDDDTDEWKTDRKLLSDPERPYDHMTTRSKNADWRPYLRDEDYA